MKVLKLKLILLLAVGCGSSSVEKNITPSKEKLMQITDQFYSDCGWDKKDKYWGCKIYSDKNGNLELVKIYKKVSLLSFRIIKEKKYLVAFFMDGDNIQKKSFVDIFDSQNKLLDLPKQITVFDKNQMVNHWSNISFVYDPKCLKKKAGSTPVLVGKNKSCELKVYSASSPLHTLSHYVYGRVDEENNAAYLYENNRGQKSNITYNLDGLYVKSSDEKYFKFTSKEKAIYTDKSSKIKLYSNFEGIVSPPKGCQFEFYSKVPREFFNLAVLNCNQKFNFVRGDGKPIFEESFKNISLIKIHNHKAADKYYDKNRNVSYFKAKQQNNKYALILISNKSANYFPDLVSEKEADALALSIIKSTQNKKYWNLVGTNFSGKKLQFNMLSLNIVPKGKWDEYLLHIDHFNRWTWLEKKDYQGEKIYRAYSHTGNLWPDNYGDNCLGIKILNYFPKEDYAYRARKSRKIKWNPLSFAAVCKNEKGETRYAILDRELNPLTEAIYTEVTMNREVPKDVFYETTYQANITGKTSQNTYDTYISDEFVGKDEDNKTAFFAHIKTHEAYMLKRRSDAYKRNSAIVKAERAKSRIHMIKAFPKRFSADQIQRYFKECEETKGADCSSLKKQVAKKRKEERKSSYNFGSNYSNRGNNLNRSMFSIGNQHSIRRMQSNTRMLRGR